MSHRDQLRATWKQNTSVHNLSSQHIHPKSQTCVAPTQLTKETTTEKVIDTFLELRQSSSFISITDV